MIRYSLKCANDHSFDSYFKSADAFDSLLGAAMVACPDCGDTHITKSLMAPRIQTGRAKSTPPVEKPPSLTEPSTDKEKALAELKKNVEKNSEYVGVSFAKEARKMHDGDAPERAIYGEAKLEEAKELIEDGVPIAPLPFTPKRKTN